MVGSLVGRRGDEARLHERGRDDVQSAHAPVRSGEPDIGLVRADGSRSLGEAAAGADDVLLASGRPVDHGDVGVLRAVHDEGARGRDRQVGGLAVSGGLQRHEVRLRIDPPDGAVAAVCDPHTGWRDGDRVRLVAYRDRLRRLVRGRVDTHEEAVRRGSPRGRVLREHVGEESRGDEGEEDGCDREWPTRRMRLLDPQRVTRVRDELGATRITRGRVLVEPAPHDALESGRCSRRRLLEVGEENGCLRTAVEGGPTRQALVEEAGERVLVGASVDLLPLDLLGSDVRGRPQRETRVEARRLIREAAGEPEVGQVDVTATVEQDVRGLDIAVHEALCMRGVERVRDLRADRDSQPRIQLLLVREQLLQIAAVREAHDQVELSIHLARVVDRDDVRMLE